MTGIIVTIIFLGMLAAIAYTTWNRASKRLNEEIPDERSDDPEGGSAYPYSNQNMWKGMTLREWYAGQVITGLCSDKSNANMITSNQAYEVARQAFQMADAMLKESSNDPS